METKNKEYQLSLLNYPESAGFKNKAEAPSKQAAREITPSARQIRDQCYKLLKEYPMTADEVAGVLGASVLYIRPRISELYAKGLIEDSLVRRTNNSGKSATVWKVTNSA